MIGAGCVLVGMVFVAVSFVRSTSKESTDAPVTTTVPVAVEVSGMASGTTAPLGSGGLGEGVGPEVAGRTPLRGFGEAAVTITTADGRICELCLLSASTADQRARGLMEVTDEDLGGYDGMLFEYPEAVSGSFWMRNTPMPLSIAFFDAEGALVSTLDMEPCGASGDCPRYPADDAFTYAIEVPQGRLEEIGAVDGATLRIDARRCPLAVEGD